MKVIHHIDGNIYNNAHENLRIVDAEEKSMKAKTVKKAKAKKVAKVRPVKVEKTPDTLYRVDMECSSFDLTEHEMTYGFAPYYPGRSGTVDEAMARSVMDSLKRIGQGGRLVEVDGTSDGKVLETWGGVGRVSQAEEEEKKSSA